MPADGRLREEIERLLDAAIDARLGEVAGQTPRPTVSTYAAVFLAYQRQRQLLAVDSDEIRLRLHVLPFIGSMYMHEVRPRDIRKMILGHVAVGRLAPRSVRHVYTVTSSLFKCALADEIISTNPCQLRRGDLPPCVDRDPAWRATAVYSPQEVEALLFDQRLIHWRRMLYGLKFFAALRHKEASRLRWNQIEKRTPLDAILLSKTKAKRPRVIPVHPTLAWMLEDWRLHGFPALMGRAPRPDDLIDPTTNGTPRARNNCQRALLVDLAHLGWRRRRGHDFRRTMITLARSSEGARDEVLRAITHGPRQDIQEQYTSWPYEVLCAEIMKLQIGSGRGPQLSFFDDHGVSDGDRTRNIWSHSSAVNADSDSPGVSSSGSDPSVQPATSRSAR